MLDPVNSYLDMTILNQSGTTLGLDCGGGHNFFDEVRLEQGGRVITRLQEYNRLHAAILAPSQDLTEGRISQSVTEFTTGLNSGAGAAAGFIAPVGPGANGGAYSDNVHNVVNQVANGESFTLCFRPTCGLLTQDKLIPLPLISQAAPLELVMRLTTSATVGVWGAAPGANSYLVRRCAFVGSLVEVGGDVLQQIRQIQAMSGGQVIISGTDVEHTQGDLPANSAGEIPIRCPIRKKSVKSLLFNIQSNDYANGAAGLAAEDIYNLSFAGSANMDSYQLKVGSVVYPPQAVNCWGNVAAAQADALRAECVMELAKSFGSLGFTTPTGYLTTMNYGTSGTAAVLAGVVGPLADGDNGDGAGATVVSGSTDVISVCPFGLDLESFQHTAIESGVDSETMALETNLILNINAVTSGIEAKNVHMFLLYDQHYMFNADGMITFSN